VVVEWSKAGDAVIQFSLLDPKSWSVDIASESGRNDRPGELPSTVVEYTTQTPGLLPCQPPELGTSCRTYFKFGSKRANNGKCHTQKHQRERYPNENHENPCDRPTSLMGFEVFNTPPPPAFPGPFIAFGTQCDRH